MREFLRIEYEQSLSLLKYYDERHLSLAKFASLISSGVTSVVLAVYAAESRPAEIHFWAFVGLLSSVTALGLVSILIGMVQNRLYFVRPARQVNAIRKTMLATIESDFSNNQMTTDTNIPAFKWSSAHTLMNWFVSLQFGFFVGLFSFSLQFDPTKPTGEMWKWLLLGGGASTIVFLASASYLTAKAKSSDDPQD